MAPKKKPTKKGKGDDEEEKEKNSGKILNNELKTIQQRIGNITIVVLSCYSIGRDKGKSLK